MTENGFEVEHWQTQSKYHHEKGEEGDMRETCEQNDLLGRKQNRPKRHLNDAAHVTLPLETEGKFG